MPKDFTISQLNRPITIQKFVFGQNDSGGNIKMLVSSYGLYASVEMISNSYILQQMQLKYGEAYRIKVRYEPSRILTDNDEIIYDGKIHKIQGITTKEEAAKWFLVINTSAGNSQSNTGEGTVVSPVREFHYIASGGETSVQDDILIGWIGVILFFRDKLQYRVITTGIPTKRQVLYDAGTGTFTFNNILISMRPDEPVDIYLI